MFAAKASVRRAARLRRNFATVVDTAGYKLAAVDNGQSTSAVTFLIKAGSRYEPKPGLSHVLKNFAFKVSPTCSVIGLYIPNVISMHRLLRSDLLLVLFEKLSTMAVYYLHL